MKYGSAQAFEAALSAALRRRMSGQTNTEFQRLRRSIAFDRLLARLTHIDTDNWLLKGGVALEYRMPAEARATTDIDLSARGDVAVFVKSLSAAAKTDLGDYFEFVFTREAFRPINDLPTTYRFSTRNSLKAEAIVLPVIPSEVEGPPPSGDLAALPRRGILASKSDRFDRR